MSTDRYYPLNEIFSFSQVDEPFLIFLVHGWGIFCSTNQSTCETFQNHIRNQMHGHFKDIEKVRFIQVYNDSTIQEN